MHQKFWHSAAKSWARGSLARGPRQFCTVLGLKSPKCQNFTRLCFAFFDNGV